MKRNQKLLDSYLKIANGIIPGATPMGAYCVGLVTALAWKNNLWPPAAVLETAALSATTAEAIALFEQWEQTLMRA